MLRSVNPTLAEAARHAPNRKFAGAWRRGAIQGVGLSEGFTWAGQQTRIIMHQLPMQKGHPNERIDRVESCNPGHVRLYVQRALVAGGTVDLCQIAR